ncbi:MAG: hypothetical protein PHR28_08025 [candidate division Zixibacteria bacterium]|nr:hypothetical protein [candidate division Zixibacteria bacterium]
MKKQATYSLLFLFISLNAFAWGGKTHKLLTYYSWQKSERLGNMEFLLRLNLDKGMLNERLSDMNEIKNLDEWLQYGAEHEDDTDNLGGIPDRSNYHFHNPLKEWNEAGLSDTHYGTSGSAILWAQNGLLQAATNHSQGDRSWNKAREYYYKALTEVEYTDWRKNYFAEMFKVLGHQVHLLQDMAVPDHVRNDTHFLNNFNFTNMKHDSFRCIEGWADADENVDQLRLFASEANLKPLIELLQPVDPESPIPFALLSDTKHYKASQTPLAGFNQGLAEYANANYFSEDTIFTEDYQIDHKHWFPHPAKPETDVMSLGMPEYVTAIDGRKDWIKHVKKSSGEPLNHLVAAGYYCKYLYLTEQYRFSFYLSDLCHEEYASKLVPRAVGYSAALLDYFFRGEIEVTLPSSNSSMMPRRDGIYAFANSSDVGFQNISLMARNITANNEEMTNGFVSLIVSYRKCVGDPFVPNPPKPSVERFYMKTDYKNAVDIPRDTPIRLDFDLTNNPIPVTAMDVNLTLVFYGILGGEHANAVAIGFKDIGEPTPVDFFNNSDRLCFNGNSVSYTDPDLFAEVDKNGNGKIDCDLFEIAIIPHKLALQYLSFNGKNADANNYFYKFLEDTPANQPGQSYRYYYLADEYPAQVQISMPVITEFISNPLISVGDISNCRPFELNTIDKSVSFRNKIVWQSDDIYNHESSTIKTFRGINYFNILVHPNISVPVGMDCDVFKNY